MGEIVGRLLLEGRTRLNLDCDSEEGYLFLSRAHPRLLSE